MRHVQKTLRMRYMSKKRYLGPQNATRVDKTGSRWSECDTCRRNAILAPRMRHMSRKHGPDAQNAIFVAETNIGFVTSDCLCEILEKTRKMNIGFVTSDCLCEILEKIWKMNIGFVTSDCLCEILEKTRKMNIGFVTSNSIMFVLLISTKQLGISTRRRGSADMCGDLGLVRSLGLRADRCLGLDRGLRLRA